MLQIYSYNSCNSETASDSMRVLKYNPAPQHSGWLMDGKEKMCYSKWGTNMFIFSYIAQKVKVHIWNEYPEKLVI